MPSEEVRAQLARILASQPFVGSQRLCRFLRFVVERTLENDLDQLKEFVVAVEVFDRNENYDPNIDSIVRVEARRLRSKLKAYYEGEGRKDPILIGLRPGSYVPIFRPLQPAPEPAPAPPATITESAAHVTVAVLPFVNMSPEPAQDYFCDGITEEIINALASVNSLRVVARTSAFQFKGKALDIREVGERLGANVVIEGSVRKAGDQLRITAQAIDAATGHHLWSETFRRTLEDIFAVQEEISTAIAKVLHVKLGPGGRRGGSKSPPIEAYTGFLRGMFLVHQQTASSLYAALEQFRNLKARYPDYAQPYAGIAAANGFLSLLGVVSGREVLPEIRWHVEEALRLDPTSPEAWGVNAGLSAHWDFNWVKGEECFQKAISLRPGHSGAHSWYGILLAMQGRMDEAQRQLELAAEINPLGATDGTRSGYLHYLKGEYSQARQQYERSFQLEPDHPEARLLLGLLLIQQQDYAQAAEVLSRNLDRFPLAAHMGLVAATYFRMGKAKDCRAMIRRLDELAARQFVTPLAYAFAYIGMGDLDHAFASLDRAITERSVFVQFLKMDPYYGPLRSDARFKALLLRLNLLP